MEPDSHTPKRTRPSRQRADSGESSHKVVTTKTCASCRHRKIKCDGKTPCRRCKKLSIDCVNEQVPHSTVKRRNVALDKQSGPSTQTPVSRRETLRSGGKQKVKQETLSDDESELSPENDLDDDDDDDDNYVDDEYQQIKKGPAPLPDDEKGVAINMMGQALYMPTKTPDMPMDSIDIKMVRSDLIQTYFEHVHPFFPIIHQTTFYHLLDQQKTSSILLYAMYAVASRWHPVMGRLTAMPGWEYYQRCLFLLDQMLDSPRLPTLQALLLMMKYHEYVRRPGYVWRTGFYLELVARLCRDLGKAPNELTKRVIWAAYAINLLYGIEQGTAPTITAPESHPKTLEVEHQDKMIVYFNLMTHIMVHLDHIHALLQLRDGKEDVNTAVKYGNELARLEKQIAEYAESRDEYTLYTTSFLRLALSFTNIMLYRPSSDRHDKHREICMRSAKIITDTVAGLIQKGGMLCLTRSPRGIPQIMHYLAAAITIHKRDMQMNKPGAKEAFQNTTRLFEQLVKVTPAIELDTDSKQGGPSHSGIPVRPPTLQQQPQPVPKQVYMPGQAHVRQPSIPSQLSTFGFLQPTGQFQGPLSTGLPVMSRQTMAYPTYHHSQQQGQLPSQQPLPHSKSQQHTFRPGLIPQPPSPASLEELRLPSSKEHYQSHVAQPSTFMPNMFQDPSMQTMFRNSSIVTQTPVQQTFPLVDMTQYIANPALASWNVSPLPTMDYAAQGQGMSMTTPLQNNTVVPSSMPLGPNQSMMGLLMDQNDESWDMMVAQSSN